MPIPPDLRISNGPPVGYNGGMVRKREVSLAAGRQRPGRAAAARPFSFARLSFAAVWAGLGVAGISAVAAAAIFLPPPHGHSLFAPEARLSRALPLPAEDFEVAQTWRDGDAQMAALGLRGGLDKAWMPQGGLSTLLATRFPHAGKMRFDVVARLPLPRPDDTMRDDVVRDDVAVPREAVPREVVPRESIARESIARVAPAPAGPQLAMLPPQQKPSDLGIFDKMFGDPDRAAKAIIAANPKTVLYDITKRAVFMPDGEKLEAHSGFGQYMDDTQSVHRKDVGVTPPNVYTVSFREKPFHGVRALRMKPVGDGNMYGRDGFLTHSFLLGSNGQSNGCISVLDYDKFLKAFEDGKFDRIIVVRNADEPSPAMVASNQGQGT